jgi:hypothetical protein
MYKTLIGRERLMRQLIRCDERAFLLAQEIAGARQMCGIKPLARSKLHGHFESAHHPPDGWVIS